MGLVEVFEIPSGFEVVEATSNKLQLKHNKKKMLVTIENPRYITITGEVKSISESVNTLQKLLEKDEIENYEVSADNYALIEIWVPEEPCCEDDYPLYEMYVKEAERTIKKLEKLFNSIN